MYIVTGPKGTIHAIATSKDDAMAYVAGGTIDKKVYTVTEVKAK
tara:strand:- start:1754 stop:1885 length:132 start_codon:yes stop_codon:yes gene_type:complete